MHHPSARPLDLKRHLLIRVILFAMGVLLVGTLVALVETRYRVRADIQRTGETIRQLITDEVQRHSPSFDRTIIDLELRLDGLQSIGKLVHFCIRITDIYGRDVGERCLPDVQPLPAWLDTAMHRVIGPAARYEGTIGHYPGITVGHLVITPNVGQELRTLGWNLINLLAICLTILLLSFLIYRPVRRALAPSDAMLATLSRMEQGNLQARVPAMPLIELNRIGEGINHLAGRLEETIGTQQRLAHRLLTAREEERLHLSRELHDEFGQYLTSLNAEASYIREMADEGRPELAPSADAIGHTVGHMMEVLQQILHRLRPIGLDQFGLTASLQQLVTQANRQQRGLTVTLNAAPGIDHLGDDLTVTLYRIGQEIITNTLRHGQASQLHIAITLTPHHLDLQACDDGRGPSADAASEAITAPNAAADPHASPKPRKSGGFGLLGMEERVLALAGSLTIAANTPRGTRIDVRLPLPSPQTDNA